MTLLRAYDCFLVDLDGVLYRGPEPIPGAAETVAEMKEAGKRVVFVTNNSARTPGRVAEILTGMGIPAAPQEIVTSGLATARLLGDRGIRSAFVIGEAGLRAALAEAGVEVLDGEPEVADVVVVGWDRSADYAKLRTASLLVQRGAELVATNADASYPAPEGVWPGAGALLAVLTTTTGAIPEVVGKPFAPLLEEALRRGGGGHALVIGDRLDSDIAGAGGFGLDSLLVLTGVSAPRDLLRSDDLPTFVGGDISVVGLGPAPPRARPATGRDAEAVRELLREVGLDAAGVRDRIVTTVVAETDGELVGAVAVELFGPLAHLRSLAVLEPARRRGICSLLVAHAVRLARSAAAEAVFAVTETAEGFFAGLGFEIIGKVDALPSQIRDTALVRDHCSESATALRFSL
jgi:glycerol-1-phosphatase